MRALLLLLLAGAVEGQAPGMNWTVEAQGYTCPADRHLVTSYNTDIMRAPGTGVFNLYCAYPTWPCKYMTVSQNYGSEIPYMYFQCCTLAGVAVPGTGYKISGTNGVAGFSSYVTSTDVPRCAPEVIDCSPFTLDRPAKTLAWNGKAHYFLETSGEYIYSSFANQATTVSTCPFTQVGTGLYGTLGTLVNELEVQRDLYLQRWAVPL
jgi:hypothetical protein